MFLSAAAIGCTELGAAEEEATGAAAERGSRRRRKRRRGKMGCGGLELPPGFRFHPTDDELVMHYLCRKCAAQPIGVSIIAEIDLYKYDPWDLPGKALYGENEWYFFSPRERKYPNGSRPNRAAGSGYWKATGADKPVGSPRPVGIKKALVFYAGKAPKGEKSNWIMHEYRLAGVDRSARKKNSSRLDDWVLCRIYNKKGSTEPRYSAAGVNAAAAYSSPISGPPPGPPLLQPKPELMGANSPPPTEAEQQVSDFLCFDFDSDSVPRLHAADSSCSEHALAPSPEFACDREVQSQPRWRDWDPPAPAPAASFPPLDGAGGPFGQFLGVFDPMQDLFMYLQKPF